LTEAAKKSGISTSYLSLIESGQREPTLKVMEDVAKALEIPMSLLVFLGAEAGEIDELTDQQWSKLSRRIERLIDVLS